MGKLNITLEDIFNIPGAEIYNPDLFKPLSKIFIDSRKVEKNSIFVAIKGENFDGHNFVFEALKKGARVIVINRNKISKFRFIELPLITVPDTTIAFGQIANIYRQKLNTNIVSITGSNGKTSTKDILATLLSEKFNVDKTDANNNNHIGVPLTIFKANAKTDVLVLEHGTNHFGEIPYSARIAEPDFAIITNIGDSHIEFLKDRNGVLKEKSALFSETIKNNGLVFINSDDEKLHELRKLYKKSITYGFKGKCDVKGKILRYTNEGKPEIEINYKEKKFKVTIPLLGETNAINFLASAAIALTLGLNPRQIISGAKKINPVNGRLEVISQKNIYLINDTYNASPSSVQAAVHVLDKIKIYKRKLLILGDIFELGNKSAKIHSNLIKFFEGRKDIIVFTIGDMMKKLHTQLRKNEIKSIHFYSREALSLYLKYEELEQTAILVKGSRGMMMEEFVKIIKERS
ncbi:MAG: UDP-N-acetylmuramoyl-tripeptide--D-alanyl-D-alanine ligase [Melioribacteraceae bacterium]|nr:UDP-N-acetylmuramoyl-tripeptide--D-alanyl-D-alanine ligase [Melioribacteraceae bacterium]